MRRVVEFDLVTKSEANRRGNSQIAQVIHAKEVKAQRAAVGAVLRANLTPPPLHVVKVGDHFERVGTVIGMTERNTIAVNLTRIAPGLLDDDNIGAALKHVRDEIAAWVLVPNDRDPIFRWSVPPAQEKSATGVYRVRIEIVDKLTGADRVVRLAETRSAGVQAAARIKRAMTKAIKGTGTKIGRVSQSGKWSTPRRAPKLDAFECDDCDGCGWIEGGAALKSTCSTCKGTGIVHRDLNPAKRLLVPPRDPGEERSARDLAPCSTCRSAIGLACSPTVPGRMVFGVHVARARAAGLHVPDDDRAKVKPARAARGPRKLVPAARPTGQAVLPILAAWCALPWEQPCGGQPVHRFGPIDAPPTCSWCGKPWPCSKGRVLTRAARYDGLDEPPTTIIASVPAEHVQRYGSTVTLTRQKFDSKATGPCWVYATTDERTTT